MTTEVVLFPFGDSAVPELSEEALNLIIKGRWLRFSKVLSRIRELEECGEVYRGVSQGLLDLSKEVRS